MAKDAAVTAYIEAAPPKRRERLAALRDLIHRLCPDVAESIEWKMPIYRSPAAAAERYIGTASQKSYLSIYIGAEAVAAVAAAVPGLKGGKGCLNITDSMALPLAALEPQIAKKFGA